jgi:hypothetical protein
MADLVVVDGFDRRAARLRPSLSELVRLVLAGEKGVFAFPDRDRDSVSGVLVDEEIRVREAVDLLEIR